MKGFTLPIPSETMDFTMFIVISILIILTALVWKFEKILRPSFSTFADVEATRAVARLHGHAKQAAIRRLLQERASNRVPSERLLLGSSTSNDISSGDFPSLSNDSEAEGLENEHIHGKGPKATKAQRRKEEKDARKAEKENCIRQRELKQQRNDEKAADYQRRQTDRERQQMAQQLEEQQQMEKQRKLEEEEYQKWKEMFYIEEQGSLNETSEEQSQLYKQFVSYVTTRKIVPLEDLAVEFKLKTKDVILRIQDLEKSNELTGIFDDSGKYIFITSEEMNALAAYINEKGRLSKANDLVAACNRIIKLRSDDTDEEKALNLLESFELYGNTSENTGTSFQTQLVM